MIKKSLYENISLMPQIEHYFDSKEIDSGYIWDILKYKYERDIYFLSMLGIHIK